MLLLECIEFINQEFNIGHILYAECFSNSINPNLERFFRCSSLAPLLRFGIDEIWGFIDEETEYLLHAIILFASVMFVLSSDTLVINNLTL